MQRNLSTVSESSDMKQNLVDETCELLKWFNYTVSQKKVAHYI